jgi:hypothetical protein
MSTATKTFEAGKTYTARSVCDHNCIISVKVSKRTAKSIRTTEGKTLRISLDRDGEEYVMPWGRYSMAPMVRA